MLAMAFLAVTTAAERDRDPTPFGLIPSTLNEFRRLFDALAVGITIDRDHLLKWSPWRRNTNRRPACTTITAGQRPKTSIYDCSTRNRSSCGTAK